MHRWGTCAAVQGPRLNTQLSSIWLDDKQKPRPWHLYASKSSFLAMRDKAYNYWTSTKCTQRHAYQYGFCHCQVNL